MFLFTFWSLHPLASSAWRVYEYCWGAGECNSSFVQRPA